MSPFSALLRNPYSFAASVALIVFAIGLPLITVPTIGSSSEGREAHVIRTIYETGEWILPTRAGLIPSKPPLTHWIGAVIAHASGGVWEWTARLPSLLSASGIVFLTVLLAIRCAEHIGDGVAHRSRELGLFSAAILTTTYEFVRLEGDARVDMTYAFFSVLAVYLGIAPFFSEKRRGRPDNAVLGEADMMGVFAAAGLACLAKGPIGVILPIAVLASMLAYRMDLRSAATIILKPRPSWILFGAVTLPWYYLAYRQGGEAFIGRQIFFENLERFVGGEDVNNEPPWFYLVSLLRTAPPWSLIYFLFLPAVIEGRRSGDRRNQVNALAVWLLSGILLLSASSGKRHSYPLPLFPGMSVFVAFQIFYWIERAGDRVYGRTLSALRPIARTALILLLLFAAALGGASFGLPLEGPIAGRVARVLGESSALLQLPLMMAAGIIAVARDRSRFRAGLGAWCGVHALMAVAIASGYAVKYDLKETRHMSREILRLVPQDEKIGIVRDRYEEAYDALMFYLERPLVVYEPNPAALPCGTKLLAQREYVELLRKWGTRKGLDVRTLGVFDRFYHKDHNGVERVFVLFECERKEPRQGAATPADSAPAEQAGNDLRPVPGSA